MKFLNNCVYVADYINFWIFLVKLIFSIVTISFFY